MEQLKNYHSHREIKFRLWDFEKKKMIYPSLSHNEKYVLQLNCEYMGKFNGKTYDPVKIPKMQFTGMLDKEGKEIFEGDIINLGDRCYKIVYSNNTASFMRETLSAWLTYSLNEKECREDFEVIGNIYQNPEFQ
jgi:uncharacterized phage protein (TIGR01671 family)